MKIPNFLAWGIPFRHSLFQQIRIDLKRIKITSSSGSGQDARQDKIQQAIRKLPRRFTSHHLSRRVSPRNLRPVQEQRRAQDEPGVLPISPLDRVIERDLPDSDQQATDVGIGKGPRAVAQEHQGRSAERTAPELAPNGVAQTGIQQSQRDAGLKTIVIQPWQRGGDDEGDQGPAAFHQRSIRGGDRPFGPIGDARKGRCCQRRRHRQDMAGVDGRDDWIPAPGAGEGGLVGLRGGAAEKAFGSDGVAAGQSAREFSRRGLEVVFEADGTGLVLDFVGMEHLGLFEEAL